MWYKKAEHSTDLETSIICFSLLVIHKIHDYIIYRFFSCIFFNPLPKEICGQNIENFMKTSIVRSIKFFFKIYTKVFPVTTDFSKFLLAFQFFESRYNFDLVQWVSNWFKNNFYQKITATTFLKFKELCTSSNNQFVYE